MLIKQTLSPVTDNKHLKSRIRGQTTARVTDLDFHSTTALWKSKSVTLAFYFSRREMCEETQKPQTDGQTWMLRTPVGGRSRWRMTSKYRHWRYWRSNCCCYCWLADLMISTGRQRARARLVHLLISSSHQSSQLLFVQVITHHLAKTVQKFLRSINENDGDDDDDVNNNNSSYDPPKWCSRIGWKWVTWPVINKHHLLHAIHSWTIFDIIMANDWSTVKTCQPTVRPDVGNKCCWRFFLCWLQTSPTLLWCRWHSSASANRQRRANHHQQPTLSFADRVIWDHDLP